MAMFLTPVLSAALFPGSPSLAMFLGVLTAATGVHIYYMKPKDMLDAKQLSEVGLHNQL